MVALTGIELVALYRSSSLAVVSRVFPSLVAAVMTARRRYKPAWWALGGHSGWGGQATVAQQSGDSTLGEPGWPSLCSCHLVAPVSMNATSRPLER